MPIKFWGECILTACHLINRTLSPVISWQTPFFRLFKKNADYTRLRVFGSLCFASTVSSNRTKFLRRVIPSVFVGYPQGIKGFKLYDIEHKRFFVSRDVVFHEHLFPFHNIADKDEIPDPFPDLVLPKSFNYARISFVANLAVSSPVDLPIHDQHVTTTSPTVSSQVGSPQMPVEQSVEIVPVT